jgi:hypothetical protein
MVKWNRIHTIISEAVKEFLMDDLIIKAQHGDDKAFYELLSLNRDLEKKQIVKAPDDKVHLKELYFDESSLSMLIELEKDPKYANIAYGSEFLSWQGWDKIKQELKSEQYSLRTNDNSTYNEYYYKFTFDSPIQGPVRFDISDYPNRLIEGFEVQILP